jgi:hypothetical protein
MKAKVYFNIRKKRFSIMVKGKVVDHAAEVHMNNARFHVNENGRQRVIAQGRKNVHAYIIGDIISTESEYKYPIEVFYNPYKQKTFRQHVICQETGVYKGTRPIEKAMHVDLHVVEGKPFIFASNSESENLTNEIIDEVFYPL